MIWNNLFSAGTQEKEVQASKNKRQDEQVSPAAHPTIKLGSSFPSFNFRMPKFPSLPTTLGESPSRHETRQTQTKQTTSNRMYSVFASYKTIAPFLPRLIANSVLERPIFSVTLQRDTVDIGGNVGILSIGELPDGVQNENMTWVPLRLYTSSEGGLPAPPDAPEEVSFRFLAFLVLHCVLPFSFVRFFRCTLLHGKSCLMASTLTVNCYLYPRSPTQASSFQLSLIRYAVYCFTYVRSLKTDPASRVTLSFAVQLMLSLKSRKSWELTVYSPVPYHTP